jgi:hypothetical protein
MGTKHTKLKFSKEKLRMLNDPGLSQAAGGLGTTAWWCTLPSFCAACDSVDVCFSTAVCG